MPYALTRAASFLARFLAVASDWGLNAAVSVNIVPRFSSGLHKTRLRPGGFHFFHRGKRDRTVLTQFGQAFGYIDENQGEPIRTIIDAGANIGLFSVLARRFYPAARLIALEIEPTNAEILIRNAKELGNVDVLEKALWSDETTLTLVQSEHPEGHRVELGSGGERQVQGISLRSIMRDFGLEQIDILKMDIEGAEHVVIESLDDEILNKINAIQFECSDVEVAGNALRVFARLVGQDFDGYAFGENVYLIRRRTGWILKGRTAGAAPFPS
jgi:FkbM family methyltransferase